MLDRPWVAAPHRFDLGCLHWIYLVIRGHYAPELLVKIKPLYPVSGYQVSFTQVKGLLLRDKHVIVGLHGSRLWGHLKL